MAAYREALRLDPAFTEARLNLGLLLLIEGKLDAGAAEFAEAARRDPTHAQAHYHLARARVRQKRPAEALPEYRRALELAPDSLAVLMGLATIRAAGPDAALRDGAEAIDLASRAARLTRRRDAKVLDVLAAAHAQAGQFPEAIAAAREALACAQRAGDARHARLIQARLALYTRSKPIPPRDNDRR
jgi:tetratricopeptide (TPR) repeat protein